MRIVTRDKRNIDHPCRRWHVWFAWYPINLKRGHWIWLALVERKVYHDYICNRNYWKVNYAELGTNIKEAK